MDNTMAQMMEQMESTFRVPRRGETIIGTVVQVTDNEVVVNIGYKSDGVIPRSEFGKEEINLKELYVENQEVEAMVVSLDDGSGNVALSIKRLKMLGDWTELEALYAEEKYFDVRVAQVTKGGVIAFFKDVKGFIPASQLSFKHVDKLDEFVGRTLRVKIIELNRRKNKAVFSRKDLAMVERESKLTETWGKIKVGDIVKGEVKRIADFGAFVDLGGVDGLVHSSELSWGRTGSVKDFLKIGQMVDVKIIAADKETNKVSLSMKQLANDPWADFEAHYNFEDNYPARVVSVVDFGVFVELEKGIEGLVHISQIAKKRVEKPSDELRVGDEVTVRILEADLNNKKLKLSIKATLE